MNMKYFIGLLRHLRKLVILRILLTLIHCQI